MHGRVSVTVRAPADELLRRWRDEVTRESSPLRIAPVEVVEEQPGRSLGWRSPSGGSVVMAAAPAPGEQGTELHVDLEYEATGGAIGEAAAKLTGNDPLQAVRDDLRRFKQFVETGEIARSPGTPEGHSAARHLTQQPAQP
jgi:uncharacterized membrane protein